MSKETLNFQAEVSKLLDIVAHSLYSHKEIFLRELISNASDACDKLRYRSLTEPELIAGDATLKLTISVSDNGKVLSIADNGVGMNRDDLIENLGTIARSGTAAFVEGLAQARKDKKDGSDLSLIGQFGVGFYSAFMVADQVEVLTRKAGEEQAWLWTSDGKGAFTIEEAPRDGRGTTVILHLNKEGKEFAERTRIRQIVRTYSDHIAIPVVLAGGIDGTGDDETLNSASALWTRPKSEISEDQYREFYHHVSHGFDDPWLTLHNRVEGVVSYTSLLFVPSRRPFDIFHPDRKQHLKLYVKRVFITDDCESLLPPYLRFVKGVVDAEDLALNISREMLQHNPVLAKIRSGLIKRILGELQKKAEKTPDEYATFWDAFGPLIKEGIYEDFDNRDKLLSLVRFKSTVAEGLVSLADYVGRMKEGQDHIFTISGDDARALADSPHLEAFRAKGVEVLLLTDPVDEFWIPSVGGFEGKTFRSVTRGNADLSAIKGGNDEAAKDEVAPAAETGGLATALKATLGGAVKEVRNSARLTDSPVCLVADDNDMDVHLQRMLRQSGQLTEAPARILEINPRHPLIAALAARAARDVADPVLADAAHLLLDQARILDGESVSDPALFARRLTAVLGKVA